MKIKRIITCIVSCILFMCTIRPVVCVAYTSAHFNFSPIQSECGDVTSVPLYCNNPDLYSFINMDIEIVAPFDVIDIVIDNTYCNILQHIGNHIVYNANKKEDIIDGHIADIFIKIPYGIENKDYIVDANIMGYYHKYDVTGGFSKSDIKSSYIHVSGNTMEPIIFTQSKRFSRIGNEDIVTVEGYKEGKILLKFQNFTSSFYFHYDITRYDLISHPVYNTNWSESYSENDKIIEYNHKTTYSETFTFILMCKETTEVYFDIESVKSGSISYEYNNKLEEENKKLKEQLNNPYTGYITIEQNNGTAAERFPVIVYSDGRTETTEEFQNYINSLNVKIEQLMNRINLISNGSCGDIDGDGNISVEDAQLLLQYYTESKVAQLTDDPIDVWYSIKYGG